jgi:hypothetical protein
MRQYIYILIAVFVGCCAVTACSSDSDENSVYSTPAQQAAQGIYSGRFIRVQNGTVDTLIAEGTLTLTATDTLNRARFTFSSEAMAELETIAAIAANVSYANDGFIFYNTSSDNTMTGRIYTDHSITARFSKAIRISARRTVRYNYEFKGSK